MPPNIDNLKEIVNKTVNHQEEQRNRKRHIQKGHPIQAFLVRNQIKKIYNSDNDDRND